MWQFLYLQRPKVVFKETENCMSSGKYSTRKKMIRELGLDLGSVSESLKVCLRNSGSGFLGGK